MPTTNTPVPIYYPDETAPVAPLENLFKLLADSVASGFVTGGLPRVADLTALAALSGANGDMVRVTEGGALFRHNGSIWVQITSATFANTSARDTAYAKASAQYRVITARAKTLDRGYDTAYITDGWYGVGGLVPIKPTNVSGTNATIEADGSVKLNATNLVRFNGMFNGDFDRYLIQYSLYGSVVGQTILGRFCIGSSSVTSNDYYFQGVSQSGDAAPGKFSLRPTSYLDIARCGPGQINSCAGSIEIVDPSKAVKSRAAWKSFGSDGSTDHDISASGNLNIMQVHDGFSFFDPGSATLTGFIRVYGYGKLI